MSAVQAVAIWALPVLFAITLHEVAHGWVARAYGDHTAERMGRLSLNPIRHIDPVGTVLVPALLLLLGGFIFGWAKPVPVVFTNLRHPKRDMAIVAVAGPLANLAMALGWALLLKLAFIHGANEGAWLGLRYMAQAGILINAALMALNLLPLPPLDGGRVAVGLLPMGPAQALARVEPYGFMILLVLLATGMLGHIISWPFAAVQSLVYDVVGL